MRNLDVSRTSYTRASASSILWTSVRLLLFFIATTTFRHRHEGAVSGKAVVNRKRRRGGSRQSRNEPTARHRRADGAIYLDKDRIPVAGLEKALREAKQKNPNIVLELSATRIPATHDRERSGSAGAADIRQHHGVHKGNRCNNCSALYERDKPLGGRRPPLQKQRAARDMSRPLVRCQSGTNLCELLPLRWPSSPL